MTKYEELLDRQLKNLKLATLDTFDEKSNTYIFKKYAAFCFEIGKCYIIELPNEIVNNSNTVLAANWNNGHSPANKILKVYVSKTLGKMIFVDSIGYDPETNTDFNQLWSGWLDGSTVKVLSEAI